MNGWESAIVAIAAAAIGGLVSWLLGWRKAKAEPEKMHAEATQAITGSAKIMLDQLRLEVERLGERVSIFEEQVLVQRQEIELLKMQVLEAVDETKRLRTLLAGARAEAQLLNADLELTRSKSAEMRESLKQAQAGLLLMIDRKPVVPDG